MTELRNIDDTSLSQAYPAKNYHGSQVVKVRGVAGSLMVGAIYPPMIPPLPGAVITSYILRYQAAEVFAATTFELRTWNTKKGASQINWGNRPASSNAIKTVTTTGTVGKAIDFDLTTQAQAWLAGAPNYGLRLDTTSAAAAGRSLYSANAPASRRPVVLVEWSAPPSTPTGFVATGGARVSTAAPVLPWVYSDPAGLPMAAYQYQQHGSDSWGAPAVDTGVVASEIPQHQASGITDGQDFWYRIRHKNSAGVWSGWSPGQQTGRTNKPPLTIVTPPASPNNVVRDVTPTVAWSQAGVQAASEATVTGAVTPLSQTSQWRSGPDSQWQTPKPLNGVDGESWTLVVRTYDGVTRAATPGDPAYIEATRTFTVQPAAGIAPVTNLAVKAAAVGPGAAVSWRAVTADSFVVERRIDGAGSWRAFPVAVGDAAQGGTAYLWVDTTAPPEHQLEYRVRPVVNGQMGTADITDTVSLFARYIWLLDPDDATWVLPVAGSDEGTWDLGEESTFVEARGADRLHLVHEGFRGYEGSCTGILASGLPWVGGLTAQQFRDRAWRTKREPTKVWRLVIGDMNIPVRLRKVVPTPRAASHEVTFGVAFEFAQQGELGWAD